MESAMKQEDAAADTGQGAGGAGDSRYYCPYPNCKRSFAELWRLKVHYRAPPDIRGSGKERGHGTELTHCPKCGKGLKPGKHHVGCSGGKAGPRQAKKSRLAGAASGGVGMDGMSNSMYTLQMQYSQAAAMPNGLTPTHLHAGGFQQQYLTQQYQATDMYGGQLAQNMSGGMTQQQPQQQQQSPALSMGVLPDQLTNGSAAGMGSGVQGSGINSTGGTADAAGLMTAAGQAAYYQQPGMQQQPLSLDSSGMVSMQPMQSNTLQDNTMSVLGAQQQQQQQFGMSASAQYMNHQAPQQQQQQQHLQADAGMYAAAGSVPDAAAAAAVAAPSTAGLMLPPQPVQMQVMPQQQQQQHMVQMPLHQQQQSPQLIGGVAVAGAPAQFAADGSAVLMQQQQQQQMPQLVTNMMPQQAVPAQQQLLSPTAVPQQQQQQQQQQQPQQLQPQMHMQQQVATGVQQHGVMATPALAPAGSGSVQQAGMHAAVAAGGALPQQQLMQQPVMQQQMHLPPIQTHVQQPQQQQQQQQQQQPQQPTPLQGQISSNMFDEIDGFGMQPPSPPPLPADFPAASGTLFNFSQFSHKLPAAAPPSQQMAMMPRGMEQELPPSLDELWTPEATYDHHSDGDLMQLLFGAPEQPPTMATIHLHHFLEDDACSSPGLLGGFLHDSMDNLAGAAGGQGEAKVNGSSAMVAPPIPLQAQQQQGGQQGAGDPQQQQHGQQQPMMVGVKAEQQQAPQQQQQQLVNTAMNHQQQPQQQHMACMMPPPPPQQQQQQGFVQQQQHQPSFHVPQDQQHMYNSVSMPVNGMNGLNGVNMYAPPGNGMMQPNGQCGGLMAIKGEDDGGTLLMQQKAAVAAATLPGAMASRAN